MCDPAQASARGGSRKAPWTELPRHAAPPRRLWTSEFLGGIRQLRGGLGRFILCMRLYPKGSDASSGYPTCHQQQPGLHSFSSLSNCLGGEDQPHPTVLTGSQGNAASLGPGQPFLRHVQGSHFGQGGLASFLYPSASCWTSDVKEAEGLWSTFLKFPCLLVVKEEEATRKEGSCPL